MNFGHVADREIPKEIGAHSVRQPAEETRNGAGAWYAQRGNGGCAMKLAAPGAFSLTMPNLNSTGVYEFRGSR